jgi:hypothetical protein
LYTGNKGVLALLGGTGLAQWSSRRRLKKRRQQLADAVLYVQGEKEWKCAPQALPPFEPCSALPTSESVEPSTCKFT